MSEVAAIILAAGRGVRFGPDPKLLALLDGKPLVRHVAEAAVRSVAKPIIAVTGHKADDVEAAIDALPIQIIRNSLFAEGLSSSLKAGFAASPPEAGAVIVLLGDMPFITANLIDELVSAWQSTGRPAALIPISDGRRGNPVVLSRMLEAAVRELSGDAGAGRILRNHPGVVEWPVESQAILQDIDTHDALRRLQA
jgi:molybdenum cofactor cytidylyltransferase